MLVLTRAALFLVPCFQDAAPLDGPSGTGGLLAWMNAPGQLLAGAADGDRNGAVGAEEWASFAQSLVPGADGAIDPARALALALRPRLDADGDGVFSSADAAHWLAIADADASLSLSRAELEASYGPAGSGTGDSLAGGLIGFGIDANGDLEVTAEEWAAATAGPSAPEALSIDELLVLWFARAASYVPADRGAIAPSVYLATLRAGLDLDRNGRFDAADLAGHFAALDASGDGTLSAEELALPGALARPQAFVPEPLPEGPREPSMPWQRSLDDALALSQATKKPLLLCVNMDGEAASESLARGRYCDPEFARLAAGFIPLLASPDRHSARDHDGRGARVPDSRFGRVTDQEHIDVEPALYERYFGGNRVAPRHVGVASDGTILFDIYLVNDLSLIDGALAQHGSFEIALPDPTALDEAGLLASPDAAARTLLEARFLAAGDEAERVRLAALALETTAPVRHPELVRMALRDPSRAVRSQALAAIAGAIEALPLELVPDALRAAAGVPERRPQLAAALERRAAGAEGPERARLVRLARIAAAVELDSPVVEVDSWRAALVGTSAGPRPASPPVELLLETLDAIGQRQKREAPDARLDALFARTALRAARVHLENGQGNPGFLLEDARAAAERAAAALPSDPAVQALLASTAYLTSDFGAAGEAAARALDGLLSFAELDLSAEILNVFADARLRTLYERLASGADWPATWVADVAAAYEVLLLHPLGTEAQALAGLEGLGNLELYAEQGAYLRRALARYPTSPKLHEFLRWQALRDGDVADLAAVYAGTAVPDGARASWIWYGALAHLVAAERRVADGNPGAALEVYRASIEHFRQSIEREPQYTSSAQHYVGLAWSGVAKVHLDRGDLEAAVEALRQSAGANAEGFRHADGLGNTPHAVARALIQLLERTDRGTQAAELESSLAAAGVDL